MAEQNHLRAMLPKSHEDQMASAVALLDQAIALHDDHIEGEIATTPASQKKLMRLLEDARNALSSGMQGMNADATPMASMMMGGER